VKFVRSSFIAWRISEVQVFIDFFLITLLSIYLVGCRDRVILPSAEQLAQFEKAGPQRPRVDMDRLVRAKIGGGAYRVVPGDVLELTMPTILQVVTAEEPKIPEQSTPYVCRVSDRGAITLPIVGEIKAGQRSLAEIESAIIDAYYPKYAVTRPSVFARVLEYKTAKVSVTGAVEKPGIYELRSDKMSLVGLLMEAGGIIDQGAALIRIIHSDETVLNQVKTPPERLEKTTEQPVEQSIKPKETMLAVPSARYSSSNEIEVQLTFEQPTRSNPAGRLDIIKPDGTTLLTEQLDITSEMEREVLLRKLAQKESRVSTGKVNRRLCALAEMLKPGSGICKGAANKSTDKKMSPNAELNMAQILLAGGFADENTNSDTEPNWSDSEQSSAIEDALYKQLVEKYQELIDTFGQDRKSESGELNRHEPLVLPVKGLNIPFADVALHDGDSIIVERLEQPLFTVMGLVNRAGNFPYPPDVRYNLMQALGFAGGLDQATEPRYATVYRLKPDSTVVRAVFKIADGSKLTDALSTLIKPGDIIAVEHTPRTRTKLFLDRVFRINFGVYTPLDVFNDR
jgi:protein involved in polysaccharide export with SLBB domain